MASLAVLISLVACAALASGAAGVRVDLTRVHSSRFVRDAVHRDMHRHSARQLAASGDTVSAPLRKDLPNGGEYLMTLAIGTPPLSYPAVADTGSDLIWTQCAPCTDQCFQQPTPLYNPASSTTFSSNNQTYNQTYGKGWTAGVFGLETFTFGSAPADQIRVPGITFGCSIASSSGDWNGSSGLVGLGRGSQSLVTQLGAGKFSYCLTPFQDASSTSTLLLGASASLNDAGVGSTPFVVNPTMEPMNTYYYLDLTGISLGTTALSIPADAFSLAADGTGGLIIDSGTTITYLVDAAYQQVRAAVMSLVTLPTADGSAETGLDLCFSLPSSTSALPAMPSMTLHFNGADMVIPADSYMILDQEAALWCLAMGSLTIGGPSILGNYQQQNMHILYDLGQGTLSFAPADCKTF